MVKVDILALFPVLRGEYLGFIKYDVSCSFSDVLYPRLRKLPSMCRLRAFIILVNVCGILSIAFSESIDIM